MKTHYELLGVDPHADAEEVKRAFRREIARYHPDKVQHLGLEFQEIASTRAAELTEAYRILMDPAARQLYDASLDSGDGRSARPAPSDRGTPPPAASTAHEAARSEPPRPPEPQAPVSESLRATQETLSIYVRKATIGKLREAVEAVFGSADSVPVNGFDAAFALQPRRGLFQKAEPPVRLLARVVSKVDGAAIDDVWPLALKAVRPDATVCLLLLGPGLAPARELAAKIAEHRRRIRPGQPAPVLVPVDTRDWDTLLPPETPPGVRKLLDRLKLPA